MNPFGSVGGKLALALLLVVTGALAIVYLIVVPSYERSLVNARLAGLDRSLRALAAERSSAFLTTQWVQDVAVPAPDARHYARPARV